ncbi:hypothetical protein [Opitutus sp. GAS368]|uniref:hypothetical protein n=1 Tax=Opitutus sp. GAS368 TaxID=1882749 RepID=UPI00087C2A8A|nr:hypothetical protein [Opitutus sp. GAS368]SDR84370.1 hypothetical protein SAMN05444173_1087 [Opitutus sp. GAS368]
MSTPSPLSLKFVYHPAAAEPGEITAARELAKLTGARVAPAGPGVSVSLAARGRPARLPSAAADAPAWMWLRVADDGSGEICATHGSFLFAAVRLLATATSDLTREKLAAGVLLPASFAWHRPHWDACLTQYWRSARNFDQEHYVASLAEAGFTHCEVNGLQAHMPLEDFVAHEYYPQFYTYAPGFNHFVDSDLTKGIWPGHYLDANLNNLVKLANLGRQYGLKPGVCMFEPRTLPERFFAKYPTLRGARVDHPFRSRLPRYTLAQDHPIVQRHYRECLQKLMRSVPDLSYMSVWTNDSGSGFEHTSSLYVGRNGGPYMIREWRNHDKIAQAAGESIVRYLKNLQSAAATINPDFDVILRLEPFKVEQDHIKAGMGPHVTWEGPSLMVRGYHVPYSHPKYPENQAVAGSIFHTTMDAGEKEALAASRQLGAEPVLHYSASSVMNHEPLLGLPFPRSIHQKLAAVRDTGVARISALGGLTNTGRAPYWPNPVALRAAQFFPHKSIETVLTEFATSLVGSAQAAELSHAWREFEEALMYQPLVGLYCAFGFCWQRTWDRPFVPDPEAVPAAEREYYERHGCFQHNNPGLIDLGKDVLFDLITQQSGAKMAADMDQNVLTRLRPLIARLDATAKSSGGQAAVVFADLRDRVRAYLHWVSSLRSVCAWCENVYGYLAAQDDATKATFEKSLQAAIDFELGNIRGLIELLETTQSEVLVLSGVAENTYFYGENLVEHLKTKLRLTEKYRHRQPRIDQDIFWRPIPGTTWPEGWAATAGTVNA